MLFLPKYGTICVCAAAAVARPATSQAARSTTDERRTGWGTRVRMGKYLGKKRTRVGSCAAILLIRPGACKRRARQLRVRTGRLSSADADSDPFGRQDL